MLRAPTSPQAVQSLHAETKVYVEFFDELDPKKRSRCWMQRKDISSFHKDFSEKASKTIGKHFPEYVEGARQALASDSPIEFVGKGTVPIEFGE